MNRKISNLGLLVFLTALLFFTSCADMNEADNSEYSFDPTLITEAENLLGISFDTAEQRMMQPNLVRALQSYEQLRSKSLDNGVYPAIVFNPLLPGRGIPETVESQQWFLPDKVARPESDTDLAFMSVGELAYLIRTGQITSTELTKIYLDRLKRHGDTLKCVITLTENLALEQAAGADREIAAGNYRGPLHGIPYGVKDLLAVEGYKTTWGAGPYREQVRVETATVVRKLEEAGAVLVAKLSMGALAMGDLWFEGRTLNPWNMEQGSSGSSAGSASSTAAGLVAFSIGTETLGSIVSPSTRCGVTGLRPTFGRVSRSGAMALSWSMDKIGPICRSAADAALVFGVIRGSDGEDPTVVDMPFNYRGQSDIRTLRIGYLKSLFDGDYDNRDNDQAVLETFREMGVDLIPVEMDFGDLPLQSLRIILTAEAAAAFDELTRKDMDALLAGQGRGDWPNTFRAARFIPAVEYIQANRHRTVLMEEMELIMKDYDVVIAPSFRGNQLLVTNLTGHPCCVVPDGYDEKGNPASISFIGRLFDEASILMAARAYQEATNFDEQHPPLFSNE
ncbi:MAG: amidase [Bacteroidales bacterium]|nr:amidase [Bacteroidales bacterium]